MSDNFFLKICFATSMPLNVMSSLPLLLVFSVKCGYRAAMLAKLILFVIVWR